MDEFDPFDDDPPVKSKRKPPENSGERWIKCAEPFAIRVGEVLTGKEILVALFIQQRVMLREHRTIRVPTLGLKQWGISPWIEQTPLKISNVGLGGPEDLRRDRRFRGLRYEEDTTARMVGGFGGIFVPIRMK
jgi:hypothetical protein